VGVEKGTRAVISVNFSACGERTFNNLLADFVIEKARKKFFNSHACCQYLWGRSGKIVAGVSIVDRTTDFRYGSGIRDRAD